MAYKFPDTITKQIVPVTFDGGLDTKTTSQAVVPGKFLVLENCVRNKLKKVEKRFGFSSLARAQVGSSSTISVGKLLASYYNELLECDGEKLYSYFPDRDQWKSKGNLQPVSVDYTPLSATMSNQVRQDSAIIGNLLLTVWEESRDKTGNSFGRCQLIDLSTGSIILPDTALTAVADGAMFPKCVAVGSHFIISYLDDTNSALKIRRIATGNPSVLMTEQTIIASGVDVSFDISYDISVLNGAAIFVVSKNGSTNTSVGYITETGQIGGSGGNQFPAPDTFANVLYAPSIIGDPIHNYVYVSYWNGSATGQVRALAWDFTLSSTGRASLTLETGRTGSQKVLNTTMTVCSDNSIRVYWDITSTSEKDFHIEHVRVRYNGVNTLGQDGPNAADLLYSVSLASKAFTVGAHEFVTVAHQSTLQSTFFTVRNDEHIVAKMAPGIGGGVPRDTALDEWSPSLPAVVMTADGLHGVPLTYQTGYISEETAHLGLSCVGLRFYTLDYDFIPAIETAGRTAIIPGGVVHAYDGNIVTELGFHVFPEDVTAVRAAAGGGTFPALTGGSDTYSHQVIYSWTDAGGQLHRSAPSTLVSTAITVTTDKITLAIPTLRLTEKPLSGTPIRISIYRSTADESTVLYHLRDIVQDSSITESGVTKTTNTYTYIDNNADGLGLSSREILYTVGGVLENIAPPACKVVKKFNNRVVLAGLEDGNDIEYSKTFVKGEGISFSDGFVKQIQSGLGDVNGIAVLDDKVVFLKNESIFFLSGDGANELGLNDTFGEPQQVQADVGTMDQRTIVSIPAGVMFKSSKGIYLLTRSMETLYVGAPVEDFNSLTITSGTVIADKNEVRFTTETGACLVFNYLFDQWSTFTNYEAISGTYWRNSHCHLKANGTVNREIVDSYEDNGARIRMAIETSWLSFAELQGFQRVYWLSVLGDFFSHCFARIKLAYNFETAYTEDKYFDTRTGLGTSTYGSVSPYGSEETYGTGSSVFQFRIKPVKQKCQSVKVRIEDIDTIGVNGSRAISLVGLSLVIGVKGGTNRVGAGKTIGA